jgi:ubiquinone/menaquinone biosynthesis C-methylase UbiE
MVATPVPQRSGSEFVRGSSPLSARLKYSKVYQLSGLNHRLNEKVTKKSRIPVLSLKGDRILDLGCGSGALCLKLFDRVRVTGY